MLPWLDARREWAARGRAFSTPASTLRACSKCKIHAQLIDLQAVDML